MKLTIAVIFYLLILGSVFAQNDYPYKLIDAVRERFEEVKDYQVDATIQVDVNFLKVPESNARITFKQPDKIKLDSEGFALLPKQGLNFIPTQLLETDYTAIFVKSDTVDGYQTGVVKVIPGSDSSGIVLSTLWIDPEFRIIRKFETTTKDMGTVNVDLKYDNPGRLSLPSEVIFRFNVEGFQIPMHMQMNTSKSKDMNKSMTGTVTVTYSNYTINTGISDQFFKEDK